MTKQNRPESFLPGMHTADVDRTVILELSRDLRSCTRIESVQVRSTFHAEPADHQQNVDNAVQQLLAGSIAAMQIRYEYEQVRWTDTIMRVDDGFRMIRIQSRDA